MSFFYSKRKMSKRYINLRKKTRNLNRTLKTGKKEQMNLKNAHRSEKMIFWRKTLNLRRLFKSSCKKLPKSMKPSRPKKMTFQTFKLKFKDLKREQWKEINLLKLSRKELQSLKSKSRILKLKLKNFEPNQIPSEMKLSRNSETKLRQNLKQGMHKKSIKMRLRWLRQSLLKRLKLKILKLE